MTSELDDLKQVIEFLKSKDVLPRQIDVSKVGSRFWISSYDEISSAIIAESVYSGMANSKETATLKSLTEKVERLAIIEGARKGLSSCDTERSDGIAALPRFYPMAEKGARENALNEAIERYAWANWWDDHTIQYDHHNLLLAFKNPRNYRTLVEMMASANFESPFCLIPGTSRRDKVVTILIAPISGGGFVSGGACGSAEDIEEVIMRGLDELFRHALGIQKLKKKNLIPSTFYEERLTYFGLGRGDDLVNCRLAAVGAKTICLPELCIDEQIAHKLDEEFVVHRCLFEGQPPFVGGNLERLCL
jgi:hypothetical protein